jgi:ribonucleoside-diphosphate reductase alpha chain
VAGCSSGIEPIFQCVYKRNFNKHANQHSPDRESSSEIVIHPLVKKFLQEGKSVEHFQTAHEIAPYDHLAMQAICQRHIDNSISKTINLPNNYDLEELSDVMREFIGEVKGITLYRDGSKGESPMTPVDIEEAKEYLTNIESAPSINDCPKGSCEI